MTRSDRTGEAENRVPPESARSSPGGRKQPVKICRLRVPLPDSAWVARFSRENPGVRIEVLSRLDVDRRRSLSEVRLHSAEPGPWAEELRRLPNVVEVEELEGGTLDTHLRVVHRTSEFIPIFRDLRLMRRFPFTIQAGEASWVVVAPESKVRLLLRRLREQVPSVALESVRHSDPSRPSGPLTPRQAELLRRAMSLGYFEVPRRITLTSLAKNFGMAPSSLSEALAIVEKKLLEHWPAHVSDQVEAPFAYRSESDG